MAEADTRESGGTHGSLLNAGNFVRTLQMRQGLQCGCPEEIAFEQVCISREARLARAATYAKTTTTPTCYGWQTPRIERGPQRRFLARRTRRNRPVRLTRAPLYPFFQATQKRGAPMKIAMIGTGYVGLVSGGASNPGHPLARAGWPRCAVTETGCGGKGALACSLAGLCRVPRRKQRLLEPKNRVWSVRPEGGARVPKRPCCENLMVRHWRRDYATKRDTELRILLGAPMQKLSLKSVSKQPHLHMIFEAASECDLGLPADSAADRRGNAGRLSASSSCRFSW